MPKLNVCFVDFDYYPPKVRIEARRLPEELTKLGFKTTVICLGKKDDPKEERVNGVQIVRIKPQNPDSCREFIKKSLPIIKKGCCDIVHLFFHPALLYYKFWSREQFFVMDIRTNPLHSGLRLWLARKRLYFSSLFFRYVIVNGEAVGREILGNRKFLNVSLGVDVDPESGREEYRRKLRVELGLSQDDLILVYSGSIELIRKLECLIKIGQEIKERKLGNVRLLVIGGGSAESHYQEEVRQKGLGKIVIFLGHKPHALLQKYLLAADIGLALVPKVKCFDNQMPLKTLEYLAASMAVVATNTKANESIVKNSFNGLLTDDEEDDIVQKTLRLIQDEKLRKKIQRRSLETVKDLTWEKLASDTLAPFYYQIYKDNEKH